MINEVSETLTQVPAGAVDAGSAADEQLLRLGYEPTLSRRLGFGSLLVYGLLFFVPMAPVAIFGPVVNLSGGVAVTVYVVAAVVMGLSAVSYREMALRFPVAGSVYGYTRLSMSRFWGFVAGWLILLDYLLMPALLTVLSAIALGHLFPNVPVVAFSVLFVAASAALNLLGLEITTRVGVVLLAIQLLVMGAFAFFVVQAVLHGQVAVNLHAVYRPGMDWGAILTAVSIAALSYLGFDAVATLNEEARGGGRAVAWATVVLLILVTVLFCGMVWGASLVADVTHLAPGAATDRAFYAVVDAVAPAWFTPIFTLTNAFVAIFSCLVVAHAATARLLFAMSRDGVLPAPLARTTGRGVPHVAILVVAAISLALAIGFSARAGLMTSLVTFGALSSYVLLHAAVVARCWFRERTGRVVVHLVVPVLGAFCLIVALIQTEKLTRVVGLSWLALGLAGCGVAWGLRRHRHADSVEK